MCWSTLNKGCNEALGVHDVFDGCWFLSQKRQGAEAQSLFERNHSELDGTGFPLQNNRRIEFHLEPILPPHNLLNQKRWNAGSPKYSKAHDISIAALWSFQSPEV